MHSIHRWFALALCLLLSGCTVWMDARRTLITEPKLFSWKKDPAQSVEKYRHWADVAWQQHCKAFPEMHHVKNYAFGFKDGFVDMVYAGGNGQPPPVPPRKFWHVLLRSPQGHKHANQWFAGYRDGAKIAREGGFRQQAVLHASVCSTDPYQCELPPFEEMDPEVLDPELIEEIDIPKEGLPLPTLNEPSVNGVSVNEASLATIERDLSMPGSKGPVPPVSRNRSHAPKDSVRVFYNPFRNAATAQPSPLN